MKNPKIETLEEWKKTLRMTYSYQIAFEEAFKKNGIEGYLEKIKELYGINTDSKEATKKKI